ncbi:MAG: peptide deformylase [Algibacter sp.]|uniref:peptide deformylase n=1 Tax=Algibacter sp. TaxID=1872428 RepID=UPI002633825D|nr:peptide deformylase [Algibacter sp.]MDG1728486.1 peptide deformylase [Algibacter sp.]MDG2178172.1 peptide deformylase [Algibacter sp.]
MKKIITLLVLCLFIIGCSSSKKLIKNSFSAEEVKLIMNADSLKPMRVYKINNKRDSLLLRTKSTYIKPNPKNPILQNFVKRLYATVRDSMSMGVGIAAPQVGILKNIIWAQRFDKENLPFEVYLNPKIVSYSTKKQTVKEGCLSIPNRTDTLNSRSYSITIEYDTMNAEHKSETVNGFTSVVFQHEIDHLNGILYLDHLSKEMKETKP